MTDFGHTLAAFLDGRCSLDELLARIDVYAAADAGNVAKLKGELHRFLSRRELPPDVRAAVERRISEVAPGHDDSPSPLPFLENSLAAGEDDDSRDRTRIAPPRERDLHVGDVLKGRYELVEELGAGGMGKVFKALDRLNAEAQDRQPYVAIKIVGREFQRYQISFIAFQREAKRAQSLSHPNIVRVHTFDRDGSHVFITMEYLSGRSLDKIIRTRPSAEISLKEALMVLKPICSALSFAHENRIVHCDIKPSNIFVTDEEVVKVIDFGIARAVKRPDAEHTVFDVGTLKAVSLNYASPELREGAAEPSERDDVYSLACVTYELLTGRHPFGRQPAGSASARHHEPAKPQGLSRKQWAGLRRALAFERDRRTPTVSQFLADLSAPADRRRPLLAAAGVAVIALAVGFWIAGDREPTEPPVADVEAPVERPAEPSAAEDKAPRLDAADDPAAITREGTADVNGRPDELAPLVDGMTERLPSAQPDEQEIEAFERQTKKSRDFVLRLTEPLFVEIEGVLSGVHCALLEGEARDGLVEVRGHAAAISGDWVRELRALPGVRDVVTRIAPLSTVHCPTLDVFVPLLKGIQALDLHVASRLRDGDPLVMDVIANVSGFLYIDYFSADGTVVHLLPRPNVRENRIERGAMVSLGRGGGTGKWPVGPPFGTEMITAIVVPEPLFPSERVELEIAFSYQEDLKRALEQIRRRRWSEGIHAAVSFVAIEPRAENLSR